MSDGSTKRIEKLLELARRGVGGERANAERALDRMLAREGLTRDDLECSMADEEREFHTFRVADRFERQILCQILYSIKADWDGSFFRRKGSRTRIQFWLTHREAAELRYLWQIYQKAWSDELQVALRAFIQVNRLYADDESDAEAQPLEHDYLMRIAEMAGTMRKTEVRRALTENTRGARAQ